MAEMQFCQRRGGYNLTGVPASSPAIVRARIKRGFILSLLAVIGTAALAFALDFLVFEIRVMAKYSPYGSVVVNPYYAVLMKDGKTQFIFNPSYPQTCVNALFPHAGSLPCWYLSRHPDRRTDI
jgi:hypothetical protein